MIAMGCLYGLVVLGSGAICLLVLIALAFAQPVAVLLAVGIVVLPTVLLMSRRRDSES